MSREQQAFRRAMRRGLPTEHGRLWQHAEELLSIAALALWAGVIIYLIAR